ncbi:unnamed protein product [Knipowitschia caucasica]
MSSWFICSGLALCREVWFGTERGRGHFWFVQRGETHSDSDHNRHRIYLHTAGRHAQCDSRGWTMEHARTSDAADEDIFRRSYCSERELQGHPPEPPFVQTLCSTETTATDVSLTQLCHILQPFNLVPSAISRQFVTVSTVSQRYVFLSLQKSTQIWQKVS